MTAAQRLGATLTSLVTAAALLSACAAPAVDRPDGAQLASVRAAPSGTALSAIAPATDPEAALRADSRRYIVVAVDNPQHALPARAGTSLPAYVGGARYGVGGQAAATLADLAQAHRLTPVSAWPISALGWHCAVLAMPDAAGPREALVGTLAQDPRVRLVQPLQDFTVLADSATPAGPAPAPAPAAYNDPYLALQHGFSAMRTAEAHRLSTGHDVRVALVDTGLDARHPDLAGRIVLHTDLVGVAPPGAGPDAGPDRHGTEVAGVIAAVANNRLGIVGIAPEARLEVYKACWSDGPGRPARCNSFTLAKALAAVLQSPARIVNLSLGGPPDPLLQALLDRLLQQDRVVVAALPPGGRRSGFPSAHPEVLVVGTADAAASADVLLAPGRDVLTLSPGGGFDYASGASIAAAHASGVAALMLANAPRLDAATLRQLLAEGPAGRPRPALDAVAVLQRLARRSALAQR